MAEMVICLLVTIATTLGAAGRTAGLLSTLPRTVVGIFGAITNILGAGVAQPLAHPAATASHTALPLSPL